MFTLNRIRVSRFFSMALFTLAISVLSASSTAAQVTRTSKPFTGAKANTGTVSAKKISGRMVLTLSEDFTVPDTPDPHWQVVDSKGNVYLLERLDIKPGAMVSGAMTSEATKGTAQVVINRSITVPSYVRDVSKVEIWCAFAETVLGEAAFDKPIT